MTFVDLTYIKKGIINEVKNDSRMHERMPLETLNLVIEYLDALINAD